MGEGKVAVEDESARKGLSITGFFAEIIDCGDDVTGEGGGVDEEDAFSRGALGGGVIDESQLTGG